MWFQLFQIQPCQMYWDELKPRVPQWLLGLLRNWSITLLAGLHANIGLVEYSLKWRGLCWVELIWPTVLVVIHRPPSLQKYVVQTRKGKEVVRPARDVSQESHRKARVDAVIRLLLLFFFFCNFEDKLSEIKASIIFFLRFHLDHGWSFITTWSYLWISPYPNQSPSTLHTVF